MPDDRSGPRWAGWRQVEPDRLLVALIAGAVALVVLYAADVAPPGVQIVSAWTTVAVIHVGLAWVARSTARMPGLAAPTRRFWRAVAAAGLIYLVGDIAQVVEGLCRGESNRLYDLLTDPASWGRDASGLSGDRKSVV